MNYKESARSPHYGKIYGYDERGKELKELDMLKLVVFHEGKDYVIGKLLEEVINLRKEVNNLIEFKNKAEPQLKAVRSKVETLSNLVILLDAKIQSLEVIK